MLTLLTFMYIFSFTIIKSIPLLTSTIFVGGILGVKLVVDKSYRINVFNIYKRKKAFGLLMFLLGLTVYSMTITTIMGIYDYSIIKTFINQFISLNIGVFLFGLFVSKNKEKKIINYLIYVFIFQALIQFLSFLSPSINEFFNAFRSTSAIVKGQWQYGGIRGLAISGSNFYGLAAAYGLIYILFFINWNKLFNNSFSTKLLVLIILLFGGLSAGRTSLVGFIIGIVFFLFISTKKLFVNLTTNFGISIRKQNLFISFGLSVGLVTTLFLMHLNGLTEDLLLKINNFLHFGFEMIYNLNQGKGLTTSSTTKLFSNMYFPVDFKTFIIGDGAYTNIDGSYYMHTDAGYMRNILFFGIGGTFLLLIYQTKMFLWGRKKLFQSLIILAYIMILHIKGDVMGFLIMTQSMLLMRFLYEIRINEISGKSTL